MNLVRSVMTFFLLLLLAVAVAGWIWAGSLPTQKMEGARLVLALCGVASLGAVGLLWTAKQPVAN
ncbi:MAG: hypothetical protein H6822_09115 [Planctomycetaceae bacterium]|nr:hypothetical protein [Planctomycetales bacterium]MCB9922330.1 hypothetical protein [Planctomycetaceae bacterium]